MAQSIYNTYLETEILSAEPVKLVCMLYRAAIEAVSSARLHLKSGEILERSRQINRAFEILAELAGSLDHQHEISKPLASLYAYAQARLLEANAMQADQPLAEVESLLSTLLDGWRMIAPARMPGHVTESSSYEPVSCSC